MDQIFAEKQRLREQPATDQQMARIWPLWNALPADIMPETKSQILGGAFVETHRDHRACLDKLRLLFLKAKLPLDKYKYHQALEQAEQWSKHIDFIQTTAQLHQDRVAKQWAFAEADAQASGRVAMFRAAKEIELTHPGLLQNTSPALEQIRHLDDRYRAYSAARKQALGALEAILYKVPGIRTTYPLPHGERAVGVPHPPDDVPHHLYIARLDALGICSPERFAKFIHEGFLKLNREQRQKFYAMSLKPRFGKEPYAALRVWIFENRPIFEHEQFTWQWADVQAAADEKRIDCPRTSLKQWANQIGLDLKRGPATVDASRIARSKPLLSPAPVFGDILKAPSA